MSEERVEAYANLLNTLISAVRQEERASSQAAEAERDALREQVKALRKTLEAIDETAGGFSFAWAREVCRMARAALAAPEQGG